jgi:UDP-N-acetylmuramoyl-L-alanyl-D-glutamate--2,6-diaminopimelate ligase
MKLDRLINGLLIKQIQGNLSRNISGIAYDSRKVKQGELFVAIRGYNRDGHDFVDQAVDRGALAVVVESLPSEISDQVAVIQVANSRQALARLSANFYGFPSKKLVMIGVTGTNGKTTTSYLIEKILLADGKKVGLLGTLGYWLNGYFQPAKLTTPESLDLQDLLSSLKKSKADTTVMEVSSQAIDLHRLDFVDFDLLLFTNLSPEHLDYHKNMDNYFASKLSIFKQNPKAVAVINIDDAYGKRLLKVVPNQVISFGQAPQADVILNSARLRDNGTVAISISTSSLHLDIESQLYGYLNVYNVLAAATAGIALNIDSQAIVKGLAQARNVKGRFQLIKSNSGFKVVIDYAHTPDGLEKLISSGRRQTKGRVITVFGCGGDRDQEKRPIMGKIAAGLSDIVIITSDNPRSEDPEEIARQIAQGANSCNNCCVIIDRKQAIAEAISQAKPEDLVLIAGKGHETKQIFADQAVDFDDFKVAKQALTELGYETN